ncbi:UDP-N-acetylmuramoyl-L-alanyl-D-glutamate--2,6-diaminopimelate ligase [Candidatus Pelagibacter sp.]|nr:UDP-N-acetylmuramoyl-L-alanyl-D-glutamate--2,6-diaminopimelate ligase [Candidatus Pelagibacter sp.]
MYLGNFIKNLDRKYYKTYFSGVAFNSKQVKKDNIFFAIKGTKFDGNRYITDAIKKGARIIISEKDIKLNNKNIIVLKSNNPRKLLAETSFKLIKKKPKNFIAVTGTNGKSSVADFYYQMLSLNKKNAASIGTIGVQLNNKKNSTENTTFDPIKLRKVINYLGIKKIKNIILEASSHGLKQNRLDGLLFDIGIFTNLSHDHLDYHKNYKDYLNAKLYLFNNLIKKNGTVIADPTILQFKKIKRLVDKKKLKLLTILNSNTDLELVSHKYENDHQILTVKERNKKKHIRLKLNLIGKIQIKNVLMAILAATRSGLDINYIAKSITKLKPAEGRLEKIGILKNNSKVILDYAHTPAALETILLNIKEQFPQGKIRLVFGCGGDRDKSKRSKMGNVASKLADIIYLTDDNPRSENPKKIRNEIKKGIKTNKMKEISNRKIAISNCIKDLCSGDIAIIAGKGHEKTQDYNGIKFFLSDRKEILKSIDHKNDKLFNDIRLNIIQEKTKLLTKDLKFNKASINSKELKKNDIFFAIKGKKNDGNKFLNEAIKRKSSIVILNKINKNFPLTKQIKVKNTLNFLTRCASDYRDNIKSNIIAITGSCGKTTLKELLGNSINKIAKTYFSPKSFNNKFGVPISLLNLKQDKKFGIFEVGMDKKGEINFLTKILKPNLGIITNISYAHSRNFKNIQGIAEAKSEIIENIKPGGSIIINEDDQFFKFLKAKALKKNLKIFSFSLKNKRSYTNLIKTIKIGNKFKIYLKVGSKIDFYYSSSISNNHIQNLLATITTISLFFELEKVPKNIFLDFKLPIGRGDISKLKFRDKVINFVDESYNSNPLSLKTALINFADINSKNKTKHVLLGDMLQLGKHSLDHHLSMTKIINELKIDKVHIYGKNIKKTYQGLKNNKKGLVLNNILQINYLINKILSNRDYLMVKGSNSTGLYKQSQLLKLNKSNVL